MSAEARIREALPADADGLFLLVSQLERRSPERGAFDATLASYFAGEHPGVLLLVLEDPAGPGGLGGYALTTIVPLLATNGPSAQLQEILVDSQLRGKAYGKQLVRAVEEECRRRGVTQLTVASRRAGGFYDRLGFHENAEYMRKFLDA